jgi:ubiquinone/menaquinone biosynthesis C-methylase UbiE
LGDALDLPFPDAHFDRAFCVDTLEWVKEPVKALHEIHRVVKSNSPAVIVHSDFDTQVFNCETTSYAEELFMLLLKAGQIANLADSYITFVKQQDFRRLVSWFTRSSTRTGFRISTAIR